MSVASLSRRLARSLGGGLLLLGLVQAAGAQTVGHSNLPRSPYPLPEPTYRDPSDVADTVIEGNGRLHSSGQWRHWGDKRNSGETFKLLFAPDGRLGGETANGLPAGR